MESYEELIEIIERKENKGISRRLDELGRLVIPKELRGEVYEEGDYVYFEAINDCLILRKVSKKEFSFCRKIDELGRIVVPIEFRKENHWEEKDYIKIFTYNDKVILKKVEDSCAICYSKKDLEDFKNKKICKKCKTDLMNL